MHFSVIVPIKRSEVEICDPSDPSDVYASCEGHIDSALKRFGDCECCGRGGHWDWYEIGGRWSGALDGYQPECDPKNYKPCGYCHETGVREWDEDGVKVERVCNACHGWKLELSWPTDWHHEHDVMTVGDFRRSSEFGKFMPYAYISLDSYGCVEDWNEIGFSFGYRPKADAIQSRIDEFGRFLDTLSDDDLIAIVDCHG